MARPKKSPEERLTKPVRFDLRPSDFLRALQRAEKAGMTLTAFARQQFLKGRVVIKQTRQLDHAAYDQLRRLGVNYHQMLKKYHLTNIPPPPEVVRVSLLIENFIKKHIENDT